MKHHNRHDNDTNEEQDRERQDHGVEQLRITLSRLSSEDTISNRHIESNSHYILQ